MKRCFSISLPRSVLKGLCAVDIDNAFDLKPIIEESQVSRLRQKISINKK